MCIYIQYGCNSAKCYDDVLEELTYWRIKISGTTIFLVTLSNDYEKNYTSLYINTYWLSFTLL